MVGPGLVRGRARVGVGTSDPHQAWPDLSRVEVGARVGVGNAQVQARGSRGSAPENGCTQRSTEAMSLSVAPTRARLDGPCEAKEWKTSHSMSRLKPTNLRGEQGGPAFDRWLPGGVLPRELISKAAAPSFARIGQAGRVFSIAQKPADARAGAEAIDYLEGADVEPCYDELEEQQDGSEAEGDAAQEDRAPAGNRVGHGSRSSGAPCAREGAKRTV